MVAFIPANSLETKLRAILTDPHTPSWSFYTPLAAAQLWIITRHYPKLDGSDLVAPEGQNPGVCIFRGPEQSAIGIYTAESRVEEAFAKWKLSPAEMTYVSAPGYQLLRYLSEMNASLWINCGLPECQYHLDPDMVEILLSRPEPTYDKQEVHPVIIAPADDPAHLLGPLRDFLRQQPQVRATWIFGQSEDTPLPAGHRGYELGLLMEDPEDNSLLERMNVMLKALTPVEMEWTTATLMADERSLRNLSKQRPPFYAAPGFLKSSAPSQTMKE